MNELSPEQQAIIDAPLEPLSVIACAGSGKTRTAVRRLVEVRRLLGDHRGRVALLSFSNVAVDTFRENYQKLTKDLPAGTGRDRVEIDTLDSFITSNILRPHAYRTMVSSQAAFLVTGSEPFLKGFTVKTSTYPLCITKMEVGFSNGVVSFYYASNDQVTAISTPYAMGLVNRLGKTGAYTHGLGRYWCHRVLEEQPAILRALVRRYPHILIDESQDIGTLHQAILEQLIMAGAQISLIGDPHQGIYEFAGADGNFLKQYAQRPGINRHVLTHNYRSVPSILTLANKISERMDTAKRLAPGTPHGAFFIPYKNTQRDALITAFQAEVLNAGLELDQAAVVCRGRELADKLSGNDEKVGQGIVKSFAKAAVLRDKRQDYLNAFKIVVSCVVGLLANPPQGLIAMIMQPARYPEVRQLHREIWNFARNQDSGLPSSLLIADTQWHPLLLTRAKALLKKLQSEYDLIATDNVGNKLAKKELPNAPLMSIGSLADTQGPRIRVDTVHKVKGESLDAVLYLANKEQIAALLAGVSTEVGRIGYVAVTRARNLLWLGVPANALKELRSELLACGFMEAGVNVITKP